MEQQSIGNLVYASKISEECSINENRFALSLLRDYYNNGYTTDEVTGAITRINNTLNKQYKEINSTADKFEKDTKRLILLQISILVGLLLSLIFYAIYNA